MSNATCKCGHEWGDHVGEEGKAKCSIKGCGCKKEDYSTLETVPFCECEHAQELHDMQWADANYGYAYCEVKECPCGNYKLKETKEMEKRMCKCGHSNFVHHLSVTETGACLVSNCECKTMEEEKEEKKKEKSTIIDSRSTCLCGHTQFKHAWRNGKDMECKADGCTCQVFAVDMEKQPYVGESQSSLGFYGGTTYFKSCKPHEPQQVIKGKDWGVWAGTKSACYETATTFDVLLNCANSGAMLYHHDIPLPFYKEKYGAAKTLECMMDWPDQGTPGLPPSFWLDLKEYLEREKKQMLCFCVGGHGRTGTAVACMMVACGYTAKEAVAFIHKNYCKEAVESKKQKEYIAAVYEGLKDKVSSKK